MLIGPQIEMQATVFEPVLVTFLRTESCRVGVWV